MIFNQRINRSFVEFINNDYDFNEFKRALNLSRDGTQISFGYGDKKFMFVSDNKFKQITDDQQQALGISSGASSFMKFGVYGYLKEIDKVDAFMAYAKSHGYRVGSTRSSFY